MVGFLMAIHYLTCFSLILVILLQSGKGGGLAGAFGGGGSTIFGGRGAGTILTRATMVLGAIFFMTSLSLALLSMQGGTTAGKSLIQEEARRSSGAQPTSGQPTSGGARTSPGGTTSPLTPGPTTPAPATPAPATPAPAPQGGPK